MGTSCDGQGERTRNQIFFSDIDCVARQSGSGKGRFCPAKLCGGLPLFSSVHRTIMLTALNRNPLWLLLLTIIARRFHSPRKVTSRHTLSLDKPNPGPQARQAFPTAADPLLGFSFGNRHPRQGGGDWDGGNGVLAWFGDACRDALHPIPAIKNCRVSCVSCIEVFKMLLQLTGG